MKKTTIIITFILITTASALKAQILTPVHWSFAAKKISGNEAVVFFKATIDKGWHLYSQTVQEGGPVKTTFTFPADKDYLIVGKTMEPASITRFEKAFSINVNFFEHEVVFQQKIRMKAGKAIVKGTVEYMTCNDRKCLPPEDVSFSVAVR